MPVKERRIRLGGLEIAVGLDERYAGAIRRSLPYRALARSAQRLRSTGATLPSRPGASSRPAIEPRSYKLDLAAFPPGARPIVERVNEIDWYHTIELPYGIATPGRSDHRHQLGFYGLPADMHGLRALDVATFDGFWAFEMERRGAQTVAIDLPSWGDLDIPLARRSEMSNVLSKPTGEGFRLAKEILGSNVERVELNVYDLSPEQIGTFDIAFLSDLLQHLRDPQRALERVYSVTRPGGYIVLSEVYSKDLEGFGNTALTQFVGFYDLVWSLPSTTTLRRMLEVAGFEQIEEVARFQLNFLHPEPAYKVTLRGWRR